MLHVTYISPKLPIELSVKVKYKRKNQICPFVSLVLLQYHCFKLDSILTIPQY